MTLEAQAPPIESIQETQEYEVTQQTVSLIDVLTPPGNRWLTDLSRRKTDLPAGVRIVRFSAGDDDLAENDEDSGGNGKRRKTMAA